MKRSNDGLDQELRRSGRPWPQSFPNSSPELARALVGGLHRARRCASSSLSRAAIDASARSVVPPLEVTCSRSIAGVSPRSRGELRRAAEGAERERARRRGVEPDFARRLLERLDEVEDVGRPAAGDRGHRVEVRLVVDPDHLAHRVEHGLRVRPLRRRDLRPRVEPGDAGVPIRAGRVGHAAHERGRSRRASARDPRGGCRRRSRAPARPEVRRDGARRPRASAAA